MQPALSTHVFLQQRLHPGLLDALHKSGAQTIEIFAARHHFDYNDRAAVRDIATWFRNTGVAATLHQPLYLSDRGSGQWSRHVAPNINLIDSEKSHRITAIDHLKAFAHPLGVRLLIENLQNEITSPEHILEILRVGHFDRVGVCLDIGHAHLAEPPGDSQPNAGIDAAFELLKPRIAQLHLHDNQGAKDDHLWPGGSSTNPGAPRPDSGT